ncbi:disease resistance protein RPS2-like isoform X2 [Macadamia integrifolia]|nr:disease resistance protein RPS2-like isoform X2 [Macadamia integrifolia]
MQEGVEASPEENHWFSQVEENASSVDNLLLEYEESRAQCRICFCSSSYQLSKKASKLKQVIDMLYKDDLKSDWTAAPVAQKGRNMDTIPIEGQTTTEKLMREIIDAVLDNRFIVVGLHGKGGIGKTTLLRHTNEYFRKTEDFESVIFTTVSATPNFVEIRKQIAESLGLKNCQDDNDLKEKLCRLLETRRYLLILDDMWEPVINLGEICIHVTKKNGCKILMASRSMSVLTKLVIKFAAKDSLQLIPVNNLPPDEAWDLFVQKVGKEITSKPTVEPIAKKVLRKCGGLPLAIVAIGGTMSTQETEGEWKDALRELEHSASTLEGMEEVFSILMFSFEKLEQIQQALFLYCCLFPENYTIPKQSLVNFAIGEETMYGSCGMHQLGDMRNKVEVWVGKLRNSSMLEDDGFEGIKMHDMMRELGVWITSPTSNKYHSKFIAKARARITEAPHASEWSKATKISLMQNEIQSLPQLQQCPQLHTLLLQQTRVKDIPQMHFLEHMPALRILDLSFTGIRNLPPSISHLVNLRLLCLMKCYNLQQLPSEIGILVQLIALNLFDCGSLRELPLEMKRLNNLRNLDIGWTGKLKRIPCGVLSGLHKLEELNTFLSGIKWYANGLEELSRLKCLTSISIGEITKVEVSHWFNPLAKCMRYLHLRNCDIDPSVLPGLLEGPSEFDRDVKFMSCKGLKCVPTRGCERLTVQGCLDLMTLLIVEKARSNAFESLRYLELDRVDQLETICIGVPQPGCFTNLEEIRIRACPNLKVLFTNGVTRLLKKLNRLHVDRCPQLVNLVSDENLEINAFPSLKDMVLRKLPELTFICSHHLDLNWPSLSTLLIGNCPKLGRLPLGERHKHLLLIENILEEEEEMRRIDYNDVEEDQEG